ncbi:tyrosine-type recombinase/integrase [Pseudomonas sp. GCM10022188]|uniref:tyrosine-type recombinase/integrase n=1 Tax=Pseudomonas TaxID=286 RepID=UPI001E5C395B|nr:site-specific integrase [Pseudomonas oryzagri]MCC6073966.1 site-specific integrase [Pseudomonas oryzagri]
MPTTPSPLFDTYDRFLELNFLQLSEELPAVRAYLADFPVESQAVEGYLAVRGFLKSYAGNETTFNSYRTHVERLLLWALLIGRKPLLELRRRDAEAFMEFCLRPPRDWIGPMVRSRFVRIGGRKKLESDSYVVNEDWRPFSMTVPKRNRALADSTQDVENRPYRMSQGSVAQVFAVCGSFFQHAIDEGLTEVNPFRAVKQKSVYKQRNTLDVSGRSLTPLQWSYVIETAERMADEDPEVHERTLFILATLFAMYLRVSDLVGRDNWEPTMGDFRRDTTGNWWFHVVGKGNKAAKISVRDDYINIYLTRYRRHLGLPAKPSPHETHPLLATLKGRAGLSDRHLRLLLQEVFDRALARMASEGWSNDEIDHLRSASLHWLRHTSATFDAPHRDMKDLQADLRHNSLSTTQNTYYNSLDEQRAHSVKHLRIKE